MSERQGPTPNNQAWDEIFEPTPEQAATRVPLPGPVSRPQSDPWGEPRADSHVEPQAQTVNDDQGDWVDDLFGSATTAQPAQSTPSQRHNQAASAFNDEDDETAAWIQSNILDPSARGATTRRTPGAARRALTWVVAAVLIVGAGTAAAVAINNNFGGGAETVVKPASWVKKPAKATSAPKPNGTVQLASPESAWVKGYPKGAAVFATRLGVLVINDKQVSVLSVADGSQLGSFKVPKSVAEVAEAEVGGQSLLVLTTGNSLSVWNPSQPKAKPSVLPLPANASTSVAGGGALVTSDNRQWALVPGPALMEVSKSSTGDLTRIGVVDGKVVSSTTQGPLLHSDPESSAKPTEVDLQKPIEGASVARWLGVGRNYAVLAWKVGNSVVIATHDVKTGKIGGVVEASRDLVVGGRFTRGRDVEIATFGPIVVNLANGEMSMYADSTFDGGFGVWAHVTSGAQSYLVDGRNAVARPDGLLAVTNDMVITNTKGKIRAFTASMF